MSFTGGGRCLGGASRGGDALASLHCRDLFTAAPAIVFGGSKIVSPVCKSYSSNGYFSYHALDCTFNLLCSTTFLLQQDSPELTFKNVR